MSCSYKLRENLWNRNAANMVFELQQLPCSVFLYKEYVANCVKNYATLWIT